MKRRWGATAAAVLVISVALNAYLFITFSRPVRSERATRMRELAVLSQPMSSTIGLLPADIDQALPCEEQLAEVETRLAAVRPELDARLTPKDKFEAGSQAAALESEIKPLFETMFADAPDDLGYDVECRGRVCRVDVHVGKDPYPWPERIQDPAHRSRWQSIMFEGTSAYLVMRDPS